MSITQGNSLVVCPGVDPGILSHPAVAPERPLDAAVFFNEHHRALILGRDNPAPWHWRGWLRVAILNEILRIPREFVKNTWPALDRWIYHLETIEAGHFLEEEIPQIEWKRPAFVERTEKKQLKTKVKESKVNSSIDREMEQIEAWSRIIGWDMGGWSDFRVFLDWLSWGFGLTREEPKIAEDKAERLYREVDLKPWLMQPWDYLGHYVSIHKSAGFNPNAFYPTPMEVCYMMSQMLRGDLKNPTEDGRDRRAESLLDPCVGSGRFLMVVSNHSMNLWGMDIDPVMVAVTKINLAMYAPWGVWPLPFIDNADAVRARDCTWNAWAAPLFTYDRYVEQGAAEGAIDVAAFAVDGSGEDGDTLDELEDLGGMLVGVSDE